MARRAITEVRLRAAVGETPGGRVVGRALVRRGIKRDVIAVPHGYGHRELGAQPRQEDTHIFAALPVSDAGASLNELGLPDPIRSGLSGRVDTISGAAVRQGQPARISKA